MVGYVGLVGLVWFVLEGSKSNTVSHSKQSPKVGKELLGQLKKHAGKIPLLNTLPVERMVVFRQQ